MPLGQSRLLEHLDGANRILVAGAGGGCDVYCGLPLYLALREQGRDVHLASLSFANLSKHEPLADALWLVRSGDPDGSSTYAPELHLARWLGSRGIHAPVYAFERVGARPIREAYAVLAERLDLDAIVLVDGGTDSLMRGDEFDLATPEEDVASILGAAATGVERSALVCTAFGVDAYHGICHAHFLENVAALSREDAYLGAFSLDPRDAEVDAYLDAVHDLCERQPHHSIVNTSLASAIEGHYGDYHRSHRTAGSRLWINPLMSLYWAFELAAVANRVLYADAIASTDTFEELHHAIGRFRAKAYETKRKFEKIEV